VNRNRSPELIVFWPLASPVVHAVHRNVRSALGSIALNLFLPALGGAMGASIGSNCPHGTTDDDNCFESTMWGLGIGAGIGVLAASTIDVLVLASKTTEISGARPSTVAYAIPTISTSGRGDLTLGWRGTF
jgi:hypothetical protein